MSIPSSGEDSHFPFEPRRAEREQKEGVAERDQKEGAAEGDQKEGVSRVYRAAVPGAVLEQGINAVKRAKYRYRSVTDEQRAKDEQIAEQAEVKARGVRDHIDGKAEADGKAAAPGEREVKAAPPPAAAAPPAGPRAPRPKYRLVMGGAKAVALAPVQQEGVVVVHRVLPDPHRDDAAWANVNIDIGPEKREAVIAETEKFAIKKAEEDKKKLDEAGQKGEKEVKAGAAGEVAIPTIAKEPPTPVEKLEKSGIEFKPEINAIKQDDGNIVCTVSLEATVPEETANKLPNFILKLIDNSGSMDDPSTVVGKTRKQLAIDSAKAIIEAAKPEDRICIILWDSDAKMLFPPCHPTEANKKIMFDLLDHYKTGGSTQMLPAVSHGLALVSVEQLAGSKEKPQIFFLTDGENNTADIDLGAERFAAQFKASGIKNATLHAIPVGTNPSAATMSVFSTAIGGGSSFVDSTKGVLKDVMSHTLKNAPKPPITSDSVAEITAPEGYQIRAVRYRGEDLCKEGEPASRIKEVQFPALQNGKRETFLVEFEPVEGAAEVVGTGVSVRFRGVKDVFTDKEKTVALTVSLKELDASQPDHILIQEIQYNAYKEALRLVKKSKSKPYQIQVIKNLISGEGGLNLLNMGLIQSLYSILELVEAVPKDEKALSFALGAALSARYNPAEWSLAKQSAQNMALELSARHKFEVVSSPEAQELVTKNPTRYIFRTSSMGDEFIGLTQMNFSDAEPPFQPERFTFKIEAPDKIVPYINGVEAGIKYTSLDDLISDLEFRQTLIDIYHSRDDVVKQRELTEQLRKINPEAEINLIREAILDADHDKLLATLKTTLKVGDQHRQQERGERIARGEAVARRAPRRP